MTAEQVDPPLLAGEHADLLRERIDNATGNEWLAAQPGGALPGRAA